MISLGNTIALYADHCKTSWIIDNPQDHVLFQHDHLCSWSQLNSMDFYIKKCKLIRISRKEQPLNANLLMYDSSLDIFSEFKDLGLLVSYNLSWNSHINCIVSNPIRMLGLISHTCKGLFDIPALKTLYCSLVGSQLEYSSVVWLPHTKRNIDLILLNVYRGEPQS